MNFVSIFPAVLKGTDMVSQRTETNSFDAPDFPTSIKLWADIAEARRTTEPSPGVLRPEQAEEIRPFMMALREHELAQLSPPPLRRSEIMDRVFRPRLPGDRRR